MYKPSIYNHYVRYNDQVLYFNALTLSNFIMSVDEHRKLKDKFSDPITFELNLPSVFDQFRDWGFFVEEGVDEIGVVRRRYITEIYDKSKIHILINLDDSRQRLIEPNEQLCFIDKLKKHIAAKIESRQTTELCIEWYAQDDKLYRAIAMAVNSFVRGECDRCNIVFSAQINVKALNVGKNMTDQNMPDAIWVDVSVVDRKYKSLSDKLTFKQWIKFARSIEDIVTIKPTLHIFLNVYYDKKNRSAMVDNIESSVYKFVDAGNVSVNIFSVADDGLVQPEQLNEQSYQQEKQWNKMSEHSINNYSIDTNGDIYFGRYVDLDKSRLIGKINDSGDILYDELKQGHYYGVGWFENERCVGCAYLPMLMGVCAHKTSYYGNRRAIACPIIEKSINLDTAIVGLFENKQLKV